MNQIDVLEAIASKLIQIWPDRMIYRDFCPVDHERPSSFLYVQDAGYRDAALGLVEWSVQAELELFAATDQYDVESTEELREDQAAVLALFTGPGLAVGDRHIRLETTADTPGAGSAFVSFYVTWMDSRPGYQDASTTPPEAGGVPWMEHFQINQTGKD